MLPESYKKWAEALAKGQTPDGRKVIAVAYDHKSRSVSYTIINSDGTVTRILIPAQYRV